MKTEPSLEELLADRERRWNARLSLARTEGCPVISITFCIPITLRGDGLVEPLFLALVEEFEHRYCAQGFLLSPSQRLTGPDGPVVLYSSPGDAIRIKALCVRLEEEIPGGRLLDIDVMDADQTPVGRSEIGLPPRKCFLCNNPAAVCVSRRLHPRQEVQEAALRLCREAQEGLKRTILQSAK